jgi:hypothetical protein
MFIDCSGLHPDYLTPPFFRFAVTVQEIVMPNGFSGTSSCSRKAVLETFRARGAQRGENVQ